MRNLQCCRDRLPADCGVYEVTQDAAARLKPFIRRVARRLARGNRTVAEDLEQEALLLLWDLDVSRGVLEHDKQLKGAIRLRMEAGYRWALRGDGGSKQVDMDVEELLDAA